MMKYNEDIIKQLFSEEDELTSDYICRECGIKHGKKPDKKLQSTHHKAECGFCGKEKSVTHRRAYGYPQKKKKK